MIQTVNLVPVIKELVYYIHSEDSDNIQELKAVVKVQKIVMDALADLLEMKAKDECNIFMLREFIRFYAVYAKSYNFLLDTIKLTDCCNEEKALILEMIENLQDIDDGNEVVNMINNIIDLQHQEKVESINPVEKTSAEKTEPSENSEEVSIDADAIKVEAPVKETGTPVAINEPKEEETDEIEKMTKTPLKVKTVTKKKVSKPKK